MFRAATCLSTGSELLLEIMGPGLVGSLLLPILGALPDALLVLGSFASPFLCFAYLGFCLCCYAFGCLVYTRPLHSVA
jgi:hypothetical protein